MMITTCGIYLYNKIQDKILICHATNSPWDKWSIPKGLQNKNEDLFKTAERELAEETGIKLKNLNVQKMYPLPTVKYQKQAKKLASFLVIINTDLTSHSFVCNSFTENNIPEVDSWKWITVDQITDYLHESQKKM